MTLKEFIDQVNHTIADGDIMDFVLFDGTVVTVPNAEIEKFVAGDDYTEEGYKIAYEKYQDMKQEELKESFADTLEAVRKQQGLTQSQVAENMGMKQPSYAQYEIGTREPTVSMLFKIADAIGVYPTEIIKKLEGDNNMKYFVMDDATSTKAEIYWSEGFDSLTDAVDEAETQLRYLTEAERKHRTISVVRCEVDEEGNPDMDDIEIVQTL